MNCLRWPDPALILSLLLLVGCGGAAGVAAEPAGPQRCALPAETADLAAEYLRLRAVQGHFGGGLWNADVDAWMGRKHRVMMALGTALGSAQCTREQVTSLLGEPDEIARPGEPLFDLVSRLPEFERPPGESYVLLIYHWRGAHDVLYFTSQEGAILGSGWWYAYE